MEKDINEPIKSMLDRAYNKALDDFKEKLQVEYQKGNIDYGEMCVLDKILKQSTI